MPSYMVEPPDMMMFLQSSFLTSTSAAWTEDQAVAGTVMTALSGRVYCLSCSEEVLAASYSAAKSWATKESCSLMSRTIWISAEEVKEWPASRRSFWRYSVRTRPAISIFSTAWGREKPSKTGTVWVTPSPASTTRPVVRPAE